MWSAWRALLRRDTLRRVRHGAWNRTGSRALVGACALGLFCLILAACAPNLTIPVTLANTPARGITVPAEIRHGDQGSTLVVVQVLIHGKGPYPMALDTGASLTLLDSKLATKLGLSAAGPSEDITGVGGAQRVTPIKISNWSLGQAQLPAMTITSAAMSSLQRSAGIDGLLGSDVLNRFGAITIDYADSQVTIYQLNGAGSTSIWSREVTT